MATGKCEQCAHFRSKRQLVELIELSTDRVSRAVDDIRKREEQWEDEESQAVIELLFSDVYHWPGRPRVLSYCGLEEEKGVSLVHELKNVGERCTEFKSRVDAPIRSCSTCIH